MLNFEVIAPAQQGLWFLLPTLPICLWVFYTDISQMRIPNVAVLAMLAIFIVVGFIVLPLDEYLWRFSHFAVVLAIGFVLSATVSFGAGDAKFAAAMAPFVALGDWRVPLILYCIYSFVLLVLFFAVKKFTPIPRLTPGWTSWESGKIPLGLALSVVHVHYLYLVAFG